MKVKRFNLEEDLERLEIFLREQYLENKNMTSWLPERLHDLIYRMDIQYTLEGKCKSSDYIFMWEENDKIVSCILPDGDSIYISIKNDYEHLFNLMVSYAEEHCKPLFEINEDGKINFLIVIHDSLKYQKLYLKKNGYIRKKEEDYDNYIYPQKTRVSINLADGYKLIYGDEYKNEVNKWSACNLGFHPDLENSNYKNDLSAYNSRKKSLMYKDSFECLVINLKSEERNDVCSYSFVYVDKKTNTAFIEPVSVREKYRHIGIGKAMMYGVMLKCKELKVDKCYVNSYDWRRKFYNACGFITEDTMGCYYKKI